MSITDRIFSGVSGATSGALDQIRQDNIDMKNLVSAQMDSMKEQTQRQMALNSAASNSDAQMSAQKTLTELRKRGFKDAAEALKA